MADKDGDTVMGGDTKPPVSAATESAPAPTAAAATAVDSQAKTQAMDTTTTTTPAATATGDAEPTAEDLFGEVSDDEATPGMHLIVASGRPPDLY